MSKAAVAIKKRLDAIADDDELGFSPDVRAVSEVLLEYHGDDAERVLSEALDLVRKSKTQ